MSAPTELRVFISSTFRDLQEEREHLVKKIFPEIRALNSEPNRWARPYHLANIRRVMADKQKLDAG